MIMNKKTLILLAASLVGNQAWAGNVTIPNNFVEGTTASAGEVNDNFTSIESAVNDNNTNITTNTSNIQINSTDIGANTTAISNIPMPKVTNVFINGVRIGTYLGGFSNRVIQSELLTVLLDTGYIAEVYDALNTLFPTGILFENTGCTGQAYIQDDRYAPFVLRQGLVVSDDSSGIHTLYYIEAGSTIETINYQSTFGQTCNSTNSGTITAYKVYVNNPTITGITLNNLNGNVTLEY